MLGLDVGLPEQMREYLDGVIRAEAAVVEEACEQAIQYGVCGVRVTRTITSTGVTIEAIPDLDVAYGTIVYVEQESPAPR